MVTSISACVQAQRDDAVTSSEQDAGDRTGLGSISQVSHPGMIVLSSKRGVVLEFPSHDKIQEVHGPDLAQEVRGPDLSQEVQGPDLTQEVQEPDFTPEVQGPDLSCQKVPASLALVPAVMLELPRLA
jgi:hypothetical protein